MVLYRLMGCVLVIYIYIYDQFNSTLLGWNKQRGGAPGCQGWGLRRHYYDSLLAVGGIVMQFVAFSAVK